MWSTQIKGFNIYIRSTVREVPGRWLRPCVRALSRESSENIRSSEALTPHGRAAARAIDRLERQARSHKSYPTPTPNADRSPSPDPNGNANPNLNPNPNSNPQARPDAAAAAPARQDRAVERAAGACRARCTRTELGLQPHRSGRRRLSTSDEHYRPVEALSPAHTVEERAGLAPRPEAEAGQVAHDLVRIRIRVGLRVGVGVAWGSGSG